MTGSSGLALLTREVTKGIDLSQTLRSQVQALIYDGYVADLCHTVPFTDCDERMLGGRVEIDFRSNLWTLTLPSGETKSFTLGRGVHVPDTYGIQCVAFLYLPKDEAVALGIADAINKGTLTP